MFYVFAIHHRIINAQYPKDSHVLDIIYIYIHLHLVHIKTHTYLYMQFIYGCRYVYTYCMSMIHIHNNTQMHTSRYYHNQTERVPPYHSYILLLLLLWTLSARSNYSTNTRTKTVNYETFCRKKRWICILLNICIYVLVVVVVFHYF